MKTHTKTKASSYQNIVIEDESGTDTLRVRKDLFFATLASHLRQISATAVPVKAFA